MPDPGQKGRLIYAIGVGLFGVALVAGVVQSLRVDKRLPAIDLLSNGSEAYINRLRAREDYDGVIEQLEMQARILPYDADTHERLGKLLGTQGRPEEARAHFQELVRLKPSDEAYCLLGLTYLNTNEPASAARCFTEAIRLSPKSLKGFTGLGLASAQLGELAEAEKCFAKAIELAPNSQEAQHYLDKVRQELAAPKDGRKKGEPDRPRN